MAFRKLKVWWERQRSLYSFDSYDNCCNRSASFSRYVYIKNLQVLGIRNVTVSKTDTISPSIELISKGNTKSQGHRRGAP